MTTKGDTVLTQAGEPAAIILFEPEDPWAEIAAEELRTTTERASGAILPVYPAADEPEIPAGWSIVHIGGGVRALKEAGIDAKALDDEEFRVKTVGNRIHIAGGNRSGPEARESTRVFVAHSPATLWGVQYLLDRHLGVRWLWPGEIGTHVPTADTITVPRLDVSSRPQLEARNLRVLHHVRSGPLRPLLSESEHRRLHAETVEWLERHQMGSRAEFSFGHAFTDWWEKYSASHPDYFAQPIEGFTQPWPAPRRVKLRLGNPEVIERIVAEWEEAGAPDYWNVSPNDSRGFDTHESSRELDAPANPDIEDLWYGRADLSARYVRFWNALLERMREINPNATLCTYAYSAYRDPPREVSLTPGVLLGMVHSYNAREEWKGWADSGAKMVLRPNWWHMGADAPHLPLERAGGFMKFAYENSLVGIDFDSLQGYWGTQGVYYYLIARLSARPDLSIEEIIQEYCSAFGSAAPLIREYFRYWEEYTEETASPIPAGGVAEPHKRGTYDEAVKRHGLTRTPLRGSWQVLPYLYTDEVLSEPRELLDRAWEAAKNDPPEVRDRIAFLRDGLDHLALTRDVIHEGYRDAKSPEYAALAKRLHEFRRELTPRHVVWGESLYFSEDRRGIPTGPSGLPTKEEDLEGL